MAKTISAPAGFHKLATNEAEAVISGELHIGPTVGTVTTAWSPEEGTLVYVGDSEGMTVGEAQQLLTDLQGALGRVAGL